MRYASPAVTPSGDGEVGPALSAMRARSAAERRGAGARNAPSNAGAGGDLFDGDTM